MMFILPVSLLSSTSSYIYIVESITGHRKTATLDSNPLTSSYRETKARYRRNFALYQADAVEGEGTGQQSGVEAELERLQEQLSLIEALEERNKAQLDSFVDEDDQWNSLEAYEKELLNCKDKLVERMDILAEQMVMLWMGQKSQDG
ncbi:unnamed protein product [Cylindrotheca closterium]|uniref:Uncharacterized protein n=1 Tax=Cylindrotheca closterium TaxID=2856 RepID=A0AAD2FSB7_9STRA|nr:unnamed protein product [Cylindrotheca closterium]